MSRLSYPTPEEIRVSLAEYPKLREKDLAQKLGIPEAQLIAAQVGSGATRIEANPNRLIPAVCTFGEVMALTRTGDCVHEKVGTYGHYHPGKHAAMTLSKHIDLRLDTIAEVWAVNKPTARGPAVSVEAFDVLGGLIFQVFGVGKEGRNTRAQWGELVETLADLKVAA